MRVYCLALGIPPTYSGMNVLLTRLKDRSYLTRRDVSFGSLVSVLQVCFFHFLTWGNYDIVIESLFYLFIYYNQLDCASNLCIIILQFDWQSNPWSP